jgi:hypothetical protein
MMTKPDFLKDSLSFLIALTNETHTPETAAIANALWVKHLKANNPLWKFVTAKPFTMKDKTGSAHVIAMVDERLPGVGLLGYFACSNPEIGAKVLVMTTKWLRLKKAKTVYGPINGTATSDYRFNLSDDYWFPGEPVNPLFYITAFKLAGFTVCNNYVSGIAKRYQLINKFFIRYPKVKNDFQVRPFNINDQLNDLHIYHELMINIFPNLSIYCPVLSWEERFYNFQGKEPYFNPRYMYFLLDKNKPIGLIVAFPFDQRLIIKTIGIVSEYRGRHLSGLLIHEVHKAAAEDNLKSAIYAMVRVGNKVYAMKKPGVKVARRYVTFKKSI